MLNAILNFPVPKTITDARSWFDLVNQLAWAYWLSPIMLPFRNLVKKSSRFSWNQTIEKAFQESKQVIVKLVRQSVSTFDINRVTCLVLDWSKDGMAILLLQKHYTCAINRSPVYCQILHRCWTKICTHRRWSSSYLLGTWKMPHVHTGLPQCYSGDWPEPLKGLFVDWDLSKIHNPCLFRLKEKKLEISFHHVTLPW